MRILVNVDSYAGDVVLLTITAPGSADLPDRQAIRGWNQTAPDRWRSMHRAARQAAARVAGSPPKLLAWTWEYQRRGALHKHVILGVQTAAELRAAHEYMLALERLRESHGYGFISDTRRSGKWRRLGPQVIAQSRAGRYVAKYLAKRTADGGLELTETVTQWDVPPLVVYVSRSLTDVTGVTMRRLRWVRYAHHLGVDPDTGELLDDPDQRIYNDALVDALVRAHAPPNFTRDPSHPPAPVSS